MGFLIWMHKRRTKGIVRAMWQHYAQAKTQYPDVAESQVCQDVIGSRFQVIQPSPREAQIISHSIDLVQNLYQACALVARAETNISIRVANKLWVALCSAISDEVSLLKQEDTPENVEAHTNALIAFMYDIEEASNN